MSAELPLVSVGVPVYNGARFLAAALKSIVEQDYPNLEILISDNASTDATADICREFAERDPRIVYVRNAENIGGLRNFAAVLARARGKYFLWAADDDTRNPEYVRRLVDGLEATPGAVLATPAIIQVDIEGHYLHEPIDRPALAGRSLDNLRRYCKDSPHGWFYGLWRTDYVGPRLAEMQRWPVWGADVMFLLTVVLNQAMAGDERAILYRRKKPNGYAPRTARAKLNCLCYMTYYLTQTCWHYDGPARERRQAMLLVTRFFYHGWIRRSSLVSTIWYHARLLVAAALSSVWLGVKALLGARPNVAAASAIAPLATVTPPGGEAGAVAEKMNRAA